MSRSFQKRDKIAADRAAYPETRRDVRRVVREVEELEHHALAAALKAARLDAVGFDDPAAATEARAAIAELKSAKREARAMEWDGYDSYVAYLRRRQKKQAKIDQRNAYALSVAPRFGRDPRDIELEQWVDSVISTAIDQIEQQQARERRSELDQLNSDLARMLEARVVTTAETRKPKIVPERIIQAMTNAERAVALL